MGLLDRLFGKGVPEFTERIWSTTAQKFEDFLAQVQRCHALGVYPVTVAHFRATQERLLDAFEKQGIETQRISSPSQFPTELPHEWSTGAAIAVLASEAIPSWSEHPPRAHPETVRRTPVSVHLAEHYPLPNGDQEILALERFWSRPIEFTCYTALDEPWLAPFGIERVQQLIAKLGMDGTTVLSHPVLHSVLHSAQQQIAQRVRHDQRCDSCEEWMQCNFPRPLP